MTVVLPPQAAAASSEQGDQETLREFYVTTVRPFLAAESTNDAPMRNSSQAVAIFSQVRQTLPKPLHGVLTELASMCEERRQLAKQLRLHRWLHLWLFVHVPLSLALLVLGVVHAVMSVYY